MTTFEILPAEYVSVKADSRLTGELATLVNEEKLAGNYEVLFNSHSDVRQNLTSGIYFYQLKVYPANGGAGDYTETKKMILIK